ncbi:ADAM23 isoform 3, partial [Pan troglodytes]
QIQALNMSSCPLDSKGKVCSGHGVCSNEATCICDFTWAGTDCSIRDPVRNLHPPKDEGPKEMSRREGSILLSKAPSESAALDGHRLALLDSGYDILAAVLLELLSL